MSAISLNPPKAARIPGPIPAWTTNLNILRALSWLLQKDFRGGHRGRRRRSPGLVRRDDFDVVISDQRMPGMSGVDLLREVKAIAPRAMRILLTGYADVQSVLRSVNVSRRSSATLPNPGASPSYRSWSPRPPPSPAAIRPAPPSPVTSPAPPGSTENGDPRPSASGRRGRNPRATWSTPFTFDQVRILGPRRRIHALTAHRQQPLSSAAVKIQRSAGPGRLSPVVRGPSIEIGVPTRSSVFYSRGPGQPGTDLSLHPCRNKAVISAWKPGGPLPSRHGAFRTARQAIA